MALCLFSYRLRWETDSGGGFRFGWQCGGQLHSLLGWEQLVAIRVGDRRNLVLCPCSYRVRRETNSGWVFPHRWRS